jgi:hypothetical protein
MGKTALVYTITAGILWETAYALVIAAGGLLIAFLVR